jgi:hypothetical protein
MCLLIKGPQLPHSGGSLSAKGMSISLYISPVLRIRIRDPESGIRNPGSGIRDPESGNRNPGSGIRDPESGIRDLESGIRDPVPFGPLDPGSGMGKNSGSGIRDEQPGSYFLELRNHFLC